MAPQSKSHYSDNDLEWSLKKGHRRPQAIRITDSKSTQKFGSDETNIDNIILWAKVTFKYFAKVSKTIISNWNI